MRQNPELDIDEMGFSYTSENDFWPSSIVFRLKHQKSDFSKKIGFLVSVVEHRTDQDRTPSLIVLDYPGQLTRCFDGIPRLLWQWRDAVKGRALDKFDQHRPQLFRVPLRHFLQRVHPGIVIQPRADRLNASQA